MNFIVKPQKLRERAVDTIFNIYRGKNIFPITYFNNEGILNEISKCMEKQIEWDGETLSFKYLQGVNLCKFLFPNLSDVEYATSNDKNSLWKKFHNDHKLRRSVKLVLDMGRVVTPTELRNKLELIGGNVATNFHPMKAKAIFEKYCPVNGVIYDFSCGFGGRMLGALSSSNNYTYIGVEPCYETLVHLKELGQYIEQVSGRVNSYQIRRKGSEQFSDLDNCVDFSFSSPPYFNLEIYSNDESQCYNKFNSIDLWFEGYVLPTIKNIHKALKYGAYYAVNIADFNIGGKRVNLVDRWLDYSLRCGFEYVEKVNMKVEVRSGHGHNRAEDKKEGIYVFQKV